MSAPSCVPVKSKVFAIDFFPSKRYLRASVLKWTDRASSNGSSSWRNAGIDKKAPPACSAQTFNIYNRIQVVVKLSLYSTYTGH